MKLKTMDDLITNGQKVEVRDDNTLEVLFAGRPFCGGFDVDPNIQQWRALANRTITRFSASWERKAYPFLEDEFYVEPLLVIWVEA